MPTPTVLDGGVATELQRRGVSVLAPWWTTRALADDDGREILRRVHQSYLAAGAQVITANTFRCNARALAACGLNRASAAAAVRTALDVARSAALGNALIAGSIAPVADCYRPDLVPGDDELRAEHGWLAKELISAGADLVLIETMNTIREARIALSKALKAGGRAWVSFVCTDDAHLLSGEPLGRAAAGARRDGAEAVLVNCTTPAGTTEALRALRRCVDGPIGAYPNVEDRSGVAPRTHVDRHLPAAISPGELAELARDWREDFGLDVLGGCCGSTPAHIAALVDACAAATG